MTQGQTVGTAGDVTLSIVIVNWNRSDLTLACIEAVRRHTAGIAYEVIVVDNGSEPADKERLRAFSAAPDCTLIALNQNLYFGEANNIGAERGRGAYLLLLNNDVMVADGYALALLEALRTAAAAGAVGPKFVYPDGRPQEFGGYVRPDGWTVQHGKTEPPAPAIAGPGLHIVDYCSAACLMLRRDVFLAMGGFDPLYDPAYFEDVDLMFRLRSRGLFTYLCGDVTVVHEENATAQSVWDRQRRLGLIADNHDRFMARWGDYVSRRLYEDVEPPRHEPVGWTPEPDAPSGLTELLLEGPGLIRDSEEWRALIRRAGAAPRTVQVVFLADEACSRCRAYTLAAREGVRLGRFSIRRRP